MSCDNVQELISSLLDGHVAAGEREDVLAHIDSCRECGARLASFQMQRAVLRNMAQSPVPDELTSRLRVMASHERERQLARVSVRTRAKRLAASVSLAFDNMMRPVALPVTGGLLSTLLLFALTASLSFSYPHGALDLGGANPNQVTTDPRGSIVTTPWDEGPDDDARDFPLFASPDQPKADYVNIVNLTIDESGKVVDWAVVRGQVTDEIRSIIVLGRFTPATNLGIPTSGVIQVRQTLPPCKYARCSATVRG